MISVPATDWRTPPALRRLGEAAAANGVAFSQPKFDRLWEVATAAGVPPLFLVAILVQEGTGSFDTRPGAGGDGGGGIEPDWERDVTAAARLVGGKLALWVQARDQGFPQMARSIVSPGDGSGHPCDGLPDQWINWTTAILRPSGEVAVGAYALHASWWVGVRQHFIDFGGDLNDLTDAARALDAGAPRVKLTLRTVMAEVGMASNWNATAPEPAVVVSAVKVVGPPRARVAVQLPGGRSIVGEIRDDKTYIEVEGVWVPVRAWAELLGAKVTWVPAQQGGPKVVVTVGS